MIQEEEEEPPIKKAQREGGLFTGSHMTFGNQWVHSSGRVAIPTVENAKGLSKDIKEQPVDFSDREQILYSKEKHD
jgi:hypothetical protein